MTSGIYAITNTITGEQYIGASGDIDLRWRTHRGILRSRTWTHTSARFQASWDQYGEDAFRLEVLEEHPPHPPRQLLECERQYITLLQPAFNGKPPCPARRTT